VPKSVTAMSPVHCRPRLLPIRASVCVAVALLVFGAAACSDDGHHESAGSTTTAPAQGTGPASTPRSTLAGAVTELLSAEQHGDHQRSYQLLTADSRKQVGSETKWARLRTGLPAITGFEVGHGADGDQVVVTVQHQPGLDPFVGLSPGEERQVWRGTKQPTGWLVDAAPRIEPVLPSQAAAPEVVRKWATAVQACNKSLARLAQAVDEIYGLSTGAEHLCGAKGAVRVGSVEKLESGPTSAELVAQYTDDALQWSRVVPVLAPTTPFKVIVAPIGSEWRVVGVSD
jgi:hypothetical protein